MTNPITTSSRIRGSILGVAVTDSLGAPAEFKKRGTFPHIDGFIYNHTFGTAPGTWTDDTSMTLCLAEALIEGKGKLTAQIAVRKWIAWYHSGYLSATDRCFDIGNATRQALGMWHQFLGKTPMGPEDLEKYAERQKAIDGFLKRKSNCGNGALMRTSPIPLIYHRFPSLLDTAIVEAAVPTHPYPLNAACCQVYAALIVACFSNTSKSDLAALLPRHLSSMKDPDPDLVKRMSRYKDLETWQKTQAANISSSGYVLDTLEAASWAFFSTDSFKEGAIVVVNLGDDADTVGAVYGGLAGAFYGHESIPSEWLSGLVKRDVVERIAEQLVSAEKEMT